MKELSISNYLIIKREISSINTVQSQYMIKLLLLPFLKNQVGSNRLIYLLWLHLKLNQILTPSNLIV